MISQTLIPLILLSLLYLVRLYSACRQIVRTVNGWPGFRTVFNNRFIFFPFQVRGISPGTQWPFDSKHADFAKAGWDVIASVNALPSPELSVFIADAAIAKEILGARARFPKPTQVYELLAAFGTNILITEGEEWKRQRKIAAPAFSERNNKLVWDEALRVVNDMFENVWGDKDVVELDHVLDITIPITLMVIGGASFGRRMSWKEDGDAPTGHALTFKDALLKVSHRIVLSLLFPQWVLRLGTPGMRSYARAYGELSRYLDEMVQERRTSTNNEERYDLFSSLLDANEGQLAGDAKLSDKALLGNVFLFLVAGHDSTSHTLAYVLIFLALYQEEQDKFYKNIMAVMPEDRAPTYEDMSSFSYSLAVFNETLRHFPPVIGLPKYSAEDTVFTTTNAAGEQGRLPVPRGTYITVSASALHHNPRYWDDPDAFKPERFLGNYPRDAFVPFSGGPRGCIGRGFAETEAVAVLTAIVSRYRVEVREEARFAGETFAQRKARLLKSGYSLNFHPERAPLVFRRR